MIRVGIVDDQLIIRQGLKMILENAGGIEVVAEGANGSQAYELCSRHLVDVLLMDIKMAEMNGVEATRIIKQDFPQVRIIILSTFDDDEFIFQALQYGASGYLLKDAAPGQIVEAISEVHKGGALIQPNLAARVVEQFRNLNVAKQSGDERIGLLTERELEIVRLVGEGKNNKEIAGTVFITEGTVKNHLTSILSKLDLRDRTQLAIFAIKNHLV